MYNKRFLTVVAVAALVLVLIQVPEMYAGTIKSNQRIYAHPWEERALEIASAVLGCIASAIAGQTQYGIAGICLSQIRIGDPSDNGNTSQIRSTGSVREVGGHGAKTIRP